MVKMSGSQALVESLKRQNVEAIFGIVGGALLPVHNVLRDSGIRHIPTRHEQGAAHAADGYARAGGRAGVCMATSGPGATNLVTGIANAYLDSSPVIAITGQVSTFSPHSSYMIGRDAFQEADIIGITTPITKYNCQVKKSSDVPKEVNLAFYLATSGRPGPTLIDLPKDVQTGIAEMDFSQKINLRGYKIKSEPDPIPVKEAVELLLEAKCPVVLAGGGIAMSGASSELLKLAELLMMPVATTFMGKGCIPENHPLSLGNVGMHGTRVANKMMSEADLLLAVGTRFSDRTTGRLDQFCPEAKVIHIDIDPAEIGKNVEAEVAIVADAKKALNAIHQILLQQLKEDRDSSWFDRVKELKEKIEAERSDSHDGVKPRLLLKELRKILPRETIVTTEVGQNQMWAGLHFETYEPRKFISSGGLGTMGFGFPAALGAKVACPECAVVDLAGDGSFRMTEQELGCSIEEDIPVTVIIMNNSVLGMVAQWQRLFYDRRYSAVELGSTPDFVKLAESYGAQGYRVGSLGEFKEAVKKSLENEVSTVIDVPISPEEDVFPMVPPGKGLPGTIKGGQ
ncbi:MAG: biosynthetic-type acetolactate synthase large subunit [Thermoproteota archaeon]